MSQPPVTLNDIIRQTVEWDGILGDRKIRPPTAPPTAESRVEALEAKVAALQAAVDALVADRRAG